MYSCCGCICILFDILCLYFLYFYWCSNQGSVDSEEEEKEETGGGVQEVGGEGGEDFITICDTRVIMMIMLRIMVAMVMIMISKKGEFYFHYNLRYKGLLSKDDDSDGDEYDF